jgi:hypothetical protein
MARKTLLVSLIVLVFAVCAFAGEGSDTIGACKLLPELRYSYYEYDNNLKHDTFPSSAEFLDWRTSKHTASFKATYGVIDNLDLFAFVGAVVAGEQVGEGYYTGNHWGFIFDLDSSFTCGVGLKGTFFRAPNGLYVGGGLTFEYTLNDRLRDGRSNQNYAGYISYKDFNWHLRYTEYTLMADLHAGWNFEKIGLTPYLGVEYWWNREYLRLTTPGANFNYTGNENTPVGVYVGLDYKLGNRLYFNVEGHMVNRWGGTASVGYLFDLCEKPAPPAPAPEPAPVIEPKLEPMSQK